MLHPAVDDMGLGNTTRQGSEACLYLGDHPPCDDPLLHQFLRLFLVKAGDKLLVRVQYARDIGEKDQLFCLKSRSHRTCNELTRSNLDVTIDASSIDTKEDMRDDHLRSADFLEVENYPTITFKSTQITRDGDGYLVEGDLAIHGVTRQVKLEVEGGAQVKDPWGGTRTGFSARTTISRKDYGLTWNVALEAGGFVVCDKLDITLEIEAVKKSESAAA